MWRENVFHFIRDANAQLICSLDVNTKSQGKASAPGAFAWTTGVLIQAVHKHYKEEMGCLKRMHNKIMVHKLPKQAA